MTRKDYIAIAGVIKPVVQIARMNKEDDRLLVAVAHNIASAMQSDNPRFDRTKFLKACGV